MHSDLSGLSEDNENNRGKKESVLGEAASNNRPISLLPIVSKVCEKTALDQLTSYLTEKQRLASNQSGNKK